MAYNVEESDLAQRLNGCYAMYRGSPYYCQAKEERTTSGTKYQLHGLPIGFGPSVTAERLSPTEPQFSAASAQFGFCYDVNGTLAYLSPGSSINHVGSNNIDYTFCSDDQRGFNIPNWTSKLLLQCMTGEHVKFSKAVDMVLKEKRNAVAFDRHFALMRERGFGEVVIIHKGKTVGWYNPKDGRAKFRNGPIVKLVKRRLEVLMRE